MGEAQVNVLLINLGTPSSGLIGQGSSKRKKWLWEGEETNREDRVTL